MTGTNSCLCTVPPVCSFSLTLYFTPYMHSVPIREHSQQFEWLLKFSQPVSLVRGLLSCSHRAPRMPARERPWDHQLYYWEHQGNVSKHTDQGTGHYTMIKERTGPTSQILTTSILHFLEISVHFSVDAYWIFNSITGIWWDKVVATET